MINTASGAAALSSNTTGSNNTAIGSGALQNNTTGSGNIALGQAAGISLTTGNNNIELPKGVSRARAPPFALAVETRKEPLSVAFGNGPSVATYRLTRPPASSVLVLVSPLAVQEGY